MYISAVCFDVQLQMQSTNYQLPGITLYKAFTLGMRLILLLQLLLLGGKVGFEFGKTKKMSEILMFTENSLPLDFLNGPPFAARRQFTHHHVSSQMRASALCNSQSLLEQRDVARTAPAFTHHSFLVRHNFKRANFRRCLTTAV